MATDWREGEEYINRSPAQRRDFARQRYRYLPSDVVMNSIGYHHGHVGYYSQHKPGGSLYECSALSTSGKFVLRLDKKIVAIQIIATDTELMSFLGGVGFPCSAV